VTPCRFAVTYVSKKGDASFFRVKHPQKSSVVWLLRVRRDTVYSGTLFNRFSVKYTTSIFTVLVSKYGLRVLPKFK
jgi:hypothetical protein